MNKPFFALAAAGLSLAAPLIHAQESARVVSSVAIVQQVAVPHQVCNTQQVAVDAPKSGAGALMGAVAGGAVGNQVGRGDGKTLATIAGLVGGAMLGNRIEGQPAPRMQEQTVCTNQTVYESRTVGYDVTYEYAGRQYRVQTPQDPGPTLQVRVSPLVPPMPPQSTLQPAPIPAPVVVPARPISVAPGGVVVASYGAMVPSPPPPAWGWRRHPHDDWR